MGRFERKGFEKGNLFKVTINAHSKSFEELELENTLEPFSSSAKKYKLDIYNDILA